MTLNEDWLAVIVGLTLLALVLVGAINRDRAYVLVQSMAAILLAVVLVMVISQGGDRTENGLRDPTAGDQHGSDRPGDHPVDEDQQVRSACRRRQGHGNDDQYRPRQ